MLTVSFRSSHQECDHPLIAFWLSTADSLSLSLVMFLQGNTTKDDRKEAREVIMDMYHKYKEDAMLDDVGDGDDDGDSD